MSVRVRRATARDLDWVVQRHGAIGQLRLLRVEPEARGFDLVSAERSPHFGRMQTMQIRELGL